MDGRLAGEQGMAGLFTILNNRRYTTVRTGIIEPDFWKLELPFLVRSTIFCFFCFFCLKSGAEGAGFRSALEPLSKRGNFRRLSARFNYSSSYGRSGLPLAPPIASLFTPLH